MIQVASARNTNGIYMNAITCAIRLILLSWFTLLPQISKAGDTLKTNPVQILSNTKHFESCLVEEDNQPSAAFRLFLVIYESDDSAASLKTLYESAKTHEAKAYALLGLYDKDRKLYKKLRDAWLNESKVNFKAGDLKTLMTAREIKKEIESGNLKRMFFYGVGLK